MRIRPAATALQPEFQILVETEAPPDRLVVRQVRAPSQPDRRVHLQAVQHGDLVACRRVAAPATRNRCSRVAAYLPRPAPRTWRDARPASSSRSAPFVPSTSRNRNPRATPRSPLPPPPGARTGGPASRRARCSARRASSRTAWPRTDAHSPARRARGTCAAIPPGCARPSHARTCRPPARPRGRWREGEGRWAGIASSSVRTVALSATQLSTASRGRNTRLRTYLTPPSTEPFFKLQNAAGAVEAPQIRTTHPFHPLRGARFPFVVSKSLWGEDRVTVQRPDGTVWSIPVASTDFAPPDPAVVAGRGRAPFRLDDLLRLAEMVSERVRTRVVAGLRPRRSGRVLVAARCYERDPATGLTKRLP